MQLASLIVLKHPTEMLMLGGIIAWKLLTQTHIRAYNKGLNTSVKSKARMPLQYLNHYKKEYASVLNTEWLEIPGWTKSGLFDFQEET